MKQTCILVLGMHRSGTSALTGVLNMLDVYLGTDLIKSQKDVNPKGFYENSLLYKTNEKLLKGVGSSWDDVFFDEKKLGKVTDTSELERVLKGEFQYSQVFAIKDPRLAYLFPLYVRALNNLGVEIRIVIPFRNPLEVANSLRDRNNFSLEKGLLLWAYHFLISEYCSRGLPRVFTDFNELVRSPREVVEMIGHKLDLNIASKFEFRAQDIKEFLTPDLKHHNISLDNLSLNVPKLVRDIVCLASSLNEMDLTEQLDALRIQLFDSQKLFYNTDIRSAFDQLETFKEEVLLKSQMLGQALHNLEQSEQIVKEQGLALQHTKQELQQQSRELDIFNEDLQAKSQELERAKRDLQAKSQELERAKRDLQAKSEEQAKTAQLLKARTHELQDVKSILNSRTDELANVNRELVAVYSSNSWKATRPLRKIMRRVVK